MCPTNAVYNSCNQPNPNKGWFMKDYKKLANEARRTILKMVHHAKTSHIASNFSVIDIATVLYENLKDGDEVVWSKGWAAAAIYYFLAKQGKIPFEDLDKFGKEIDGKIQYLGLAETTTPGVQVNGGSVGHGLPIAVGIAKAKKLMGEKGTVYCILSDGELNEGTVWESAAYAHTHALDNLVILVDANGWQAMGKTKEVIDIDPQKAFEGFQLESIEIDGHSFLSIEGALLMPRYKPLAITCKTIKGKGVSFFEDHLLFHYKHVEEDEYAKALAELN